MAYWEVPNEREQEILRRMNNDPEEYAVHRVGVDRLIFLHYRTRQEFAYPIYRMEENYGGKRKAESVRA